MSDKVVKLGRTEIYKGSRVHLVKEQLRFPNGKEAEWELIVHPGAAAVIPVDADGRILMVKQYRNASHTETLEIPAGTLDHPDEDPGDCAARELEEETGFKANTVEFLYSFYSAIGITDEMIHIYVARDLEETQQNLDEDEYVTLERFTLGELVEMILNGTIKDNKTISSLLFYKEKYKL